MKTSSKVLVALVLVVGSGGAVAGEAGRLAGEAGKLATGQVVITLVYRWSCRRSSSFSPG
jgi:hypothetical protein